jgi:hypothetical protein
VNARLTVIGALISMNFAVTGVAGDPVETPKGQVVAAFTI